MSVSSARRYLASLKSGIAGLSTVRITQPSKSSREAGTSSAMNSDRYAGVPPTME
jgi:hypothetical protein